MLKAIETRWRGYRFRSRLEARWAVFLDSVGIEFLYEPETFRWRSMLYLPDFYLPHIRWFAEVKPAAFEPDELFKAESLVRHSRRSLLMLEGQPNYRDYTGLSLDAGEITHCPYRLDIWQHDGVYYSDEHRLFACPSDELTIESASARYRRAVEDSRGERFGS